MTETGRRRPQRHRTLKAGKIVLSHGTSVVDCTIRNLSPEGAAIAVDNAATLPAEFDLKFGGETRHCTVAWRRLNRLGMKFG
jgi:PilZ domain